MNKLRAEIRKQYEEMMRNKTPRVSSRVEINEMNPNKLAIVNQIIENKKMSIDNEKLNMTIKKANVPIQRREIIVLDSIPKKPSQPETTTASQTQVKICQARNLNGTPCKCKAKIGKFCTKHAP